MSVCNCPDAWTRRLLRQRKTRSSHPAWDATACRNRCNHSNIGKNIGKRQSSSAISYTWRLADMLEAEAATGSSGKRSEAVGTECRHSNWRARAAVGVQCRDRPLLRADRVAADTGTHCRGLQAV